ncbi:MAG TPA: hypothetical protein VN418_02540 [Gammaproteobacteria bacterium]|nr:hypothetical protein [Gammaproteobacteria bacterium]
MIEAKNYIRILVIACLASVAVVAGLNYAVDPFSVFGAPRIAGFNANKVDFLEHLRMTNVYAVKRIKPKCIILGTSRAGRGLSPDHPALAVTPCYNMALPAIGLYEMRRYFQHAQAIQPLDHAILALDFRVFNTTPDRSGAFSETRLAVDREGIAQFNLFSAHMPDLAAALLSTKALLSSVKTVRQQRWANITLATNGYWQSLTDTYDHAAAFNAYTRNSFRRFEDIAHNDPTFSQNADDLRALLRAAYQSTVKVSVLISPSHAWHWETLHQSGLWPRFEEMKRMIVSINHEEATRVEKAEYQVWDFSGAVDPSLEPLPAGGKQKAMRWYWEPVHYKRALGDAVLSRVLTDQAPAFPVLAGFGTKITPANLEEHLRRLRTLQKQYAQAHPEDVAHIRELMPKNQTRKGMQ